MNEKNAGGQQDQADDIFAYFFERGQATCVCEKTIGENFPAKNRKQHDSHENTISQEIKTGSNPKIQQNRNSQQGETFHVTGGYPQLRGGIGVIADEYVHTCERQGVHKINNGDKKVSYTDMQQIGIGTEITRVPGHHKNSAGDDDRKHLGDAMKKKVIVLASCIEPD